MKRRHFLRSVGDWIFSWITAICTYWSVPGTYTGLHRIYPPPPRLGPPIKTTPPVEESAGIFDGSPLPVVILPNGEQMDLYDLHVVNQIRTADDGRYKALLRPEKIVVHRIGPDLDCRVNDCHYCQTEHAHTDKSHSFALHVCRWFQTHPRIGLTGGANPYHFIIDFDKTEQALCLDECGAHARRWNSKSIAIALRGDFNYRHPTPYQKSALYQLCCLLSLSLGSIDIWGHTELPGATKDPLKRCPGVYLRMEQFREAVLDKLRGKMRDYTKDEIKEMLTSCGISVDGV